MWPPITVIQSPRERLSKCSLRYLHDRDDVTFLKAIHNFRFDATGFTILAVDAPEISPEDGDRPLLLLDSTWKLLPKLIRTVHGAPVERSIPPGVTTAYPRKSKVFEDPDSGLASIEALFVARAILGHVDHSLLDGYHWREAFVENVLAAGIPLDSPDGTSGPHFGFRNRDERAK